MRTIRNAKDLIGKTIMIGGWGYIKVLDVIDIFEVPFLVVEKDEKDDKITYINLRNIGWFKEWKE